ncbi:hypothetical protein QVD17_19329 [Tagetes erecta]|uniref:Uncharacterized protein n=1 Tax=Tagetes erecta TaxID=13708 RepID=A0AAD8KJJ4_TARER|nr:hypothetical protein QVD17_19329 [Tagetes erecta]
MTQDHPRNEHLASTKVKKSVHHKTDPKHTKLVGSSFHDSSSETQLTTSSRYCSLNYLSLFLTFFILLRSIRLLIASLADLYLNLLPYFILCVILKWRQYWLLTAAIAVMYNW